MVSPEKQATPLRRAEDGDLACVEHLDFVLVRFLLVALVGARSMMRGWVFGPRGGGFHFCHSSAGDHQGAFDGGIQRGLPAGA